MESPFPTSVSAIHPPMFAKTAMVNHGKTQNSPDSVRLNFKTWENRLGKIKGKTDFPLKQDKQIYRSF